MSIYRFLTERSIRLSFIHLAILATVTAGTTYFFLRDADDKLDSVREAQHRAREVRLREDLADARAEIRVLKEAETQRNGTAQSTPALLTEQTLDVHAHDHNVDTMSDDTVEVVHTGPLKGLPVDVAKEIHKEYTAASVARARRYHEWDLRRKDHKERDNALAKKELANGDALLANSKKLSEITLAVLALMSPEELEAERKEALKTQPAEEVDSFLRKVEEYRTATSPEEINQAVQGYEKTKETLVIKREELLAEREQLNREWDELQRTKPLPPNLGLDEFYTEWKKRNRPNPSP